MFGEASGPLMLSETLHNTKTTNSSATGDIHWKKISLSFHYFVIFQVTSISLRLRFVGTSSGLKRFTTGAFTEVFFVTNIYLITYKF